MLDRSPLGPFRNGSRVSGGSINMVVIRKMRESELTMQSWDVFICHASEDKQRFVEPLAKRLRELAVRVWYDKFVLVPGDRISEKIAEGLARCRAGVLVFSKAFISKPWTRYEMSGLVNRFVEEETRLIPIWLDVARKDIANFNPALADLLAIVANPDDIDASAFEILRTIRPQLYENLSMLSQISDAPVRVETVPRSALKSGPIRHHDLEESLLIRIQNLWYATRQFSNRSWKDWIEGFQRDLRPEREVAIWERILSGLQIAVEKLTNADADTKLQAFRILVSFSIGNHESVFEKTENGEYHPSVTDAAVEAWLNVVPPVAVSDVEETGG